MNQIKIIATVIFTFIVFASAFSQTKLQAITGKVIDNKTGKGIENATLTLYDKERSVICLLQTNELGMYKIHLVEEVYKIKADALSYNEAEVSFSNFSKVGGNTVVVFGLDTSNEVRDKQVVEIRDKQVAEIRLPILNYDFNSSYFNEDNKRALKIVGAYLREHPEVRIRINSHAINHGTDKYNDWMTERRVNRIATWLKDKEGITADRLELSYYGYGKLRKINSDPNIENRNCSFEILK